MHRADWEEPGAAVTGTAGAFGTRREEPAGGRGHRVSGTFGPALPMPHRQRIGCIGTGCGGWPVEQEGAAAMAVQVGINGELVKVFGWDDNEWGYTPGAARPRRVRRRTAGLIP
jgi:hypothetical protein